MISSRWPWLNTKTHYALPQTTLHTNALTQSASDAVWEHYISPEAAAEFDGMYVIDSSFWGTGLYLSGRNFFSVSMYITRPSRPPSSTGMAASTDRVIQNCNPYNIHHTPKPIRLYTNHTSDASWRMGCKSKSYKFWALLKLLPITKVKSCKSLSIHKNYEITMSRETQ